MATGLSRAIPARTTPLRRLGWDGLMEDGEDPLPESQAATETEHRGCPLDPPDHRSRDSFQVRQLDREGPEQLDHNHRVKASLARLAPPAEGA
jgi:hypothetical protein